MIKLKKLVVVSIFIFCVEPVLAFDFFDNLDINIFW